MRTRADVGQVSLVGIAIAMVIVALLTGLSVAVLVNGGSTGNDGTAATGPVGATDDAAAQSTLSQAQTTAAQAAAAAGYGALDATALSSAEPGLTFTDGPSSSDSAVSVAGAGGSALPGGAGAVPGVPGGAVPGVPGGAVPGVGGTPGGGGSLMLGVFSPSDTCWYVWLGSGGPLYGAQTGQRACQAQPLATAPATGPVSDSAVGWAAGAFPAP
jgi:hypothetical protein